jgi:ribose transport system ATP-binding protein
VTITLTSTANGTEGTPTSHGGTPPVSVAPAVEIRDLSKTFTGTKALDGVSIDVYPGEVHSLVGGNGSGKSTLIKVLSGVYTGDSGGHISIQGEEIASDRVNPEFARRAGIHVVHQDLGVFLGLSVAENLALGHGYPHAGAQVRWGQLRKRARQLLDRFEIDADPSTPLRDLSQAVRTQVAIARALQDQDEGSRGLLILDEPTASLPVHEVELLLTTLKRYADRGQAILYVSHRLDEVLRLSRTVTVLRDGNVVAMLTGDSISESNLIDGIVGKQIDRVFPAMPAVQDTRPLLEIRGLSAGPLRDVDLSLARGEVVGVCGLLGSGRSELLRALYGDLPVEAGSVTMDDEELTVRRPADAIAAGIAYVPEDRANDAAFPALSVTANLAMPSLRRYWRRGHIADRPLRRDARVSMQRFMVRAASQTSPLATLSGGNQQKVILARWLARNPSILLLDEPTQGVDVGARAEIYELVRQAVEGGAAALIVASDFEELAHVSDRVVLLTNGRVSGEVRPPDLTADLLMRAANKGTNGGSGGI